MEKESFVSSLLSTSSHPSSGKGPLIQEVGLESEQESVVEKSEDEGPTMLEMMMAAQAEAKREKEKDQKKATAKTSKSFGNGFKKGFFDSEPKKKEISKPKEDKTEQIPTIVKSKAPQNSAIISEVQEALKKEESPLLSQLRQGDWVSPDLMAVFQSNKILSAGFRSPKCTAALELLKSNPKEAQKKFSSDQEVSNFLAEFARVMSTHFEELGKKEPSSTPQQVPPTPAPAIQELGPLHAEALRRQKQNESVKPVGKSGAAGAVAVSQGSSGRDDADAARVQEIIADPELRDMLMDPQLQRILQECGDPRLFQKHMSNPETARKIKKLYDSGLVGTAK